MKKIISMVLAAAIAAGLSTGCGSKLEKRPGIYAGYQHSLLIKPDGSLWAWGNNRERQLGDDTKESKLTPTKVMDDVVAVCAGYGEHTLAIKANGSLLAWGYNSDGQIGNGEKWTGTAKQKIIKVMDDVIAASGGYAHSLAIKSDGSLWAWGDNKFGQLGDGTTTDSLTPVEIMDDVTAISAGPYFSAAVKSDGSLWAWGNNDRGQIGDGTITLFEDNDISNGQIIEDNKKLTPVKIMDDVTMVSAGFNHILAIKSDGSLWGWGQLLAGDSGGHISTVYDWDTGTSYDEIASSVLPWKIMDDVISADAGHIRSFALKSDGSLWAWGHIGNSGTTRKPTEIMDDVVEVNAGWFHALAIKTDGSYWAWGNNEHGQIGNGTTSDFFTFVDPVKIMD